MPPIDLENPSTMGDLVDIKSNPDTKADFYMVRRGSADKVGMPTKDHNPEHYGVYVKRPDVVDPNYLYYAMTYLHGNGAFKKSARGTTNLVNIRKEDITGIPLSRASGGKVNNTLVDHALRLTAALRSR
jgi:hypothetical protein